MLRVNFSYTYKFIIHLWRSRLEPLFPALTEHNALRRWLEAEFPDADEQSLRDTLEGLSSLPEVLAYVVRSYLDDLTLTAALDMRISEMQQRSARLVQRAEKKRELVSHVMQQADIRKLRESDFTASLRAVPPNVIIIDEAQIPDDYWKPQPPKLDRQKLGLALKAGASISGALLGNGSTILSVRTR